MLYNSVMTIVLMMAIPFFLGGCVKRCALVEFGDRVASASFCYVMGHVIMWAMFQLVAVPLILAKAKLSVAIILWIAMLVILSVVMLSRIFSGNKKNERKVVASEKSRTKEERCVFAFSILLVMVLVGYQCYMYIRYMHLDEDDTRFVVNAIDAYNNGTMFLTHPATGNYEGTWIGEMVKDVSSPWSIYLAALSKLACIHPTILAHTIYPPFLLLAGYMAYYLIGNIIFHGEKAKSFFFVALAAAINMTFGQSVYNQSYFSLVRIWQGKATVAGVMIPFLLYMLYYIYQHPSKVSGYILLIPSAMAMCLMSGMGIFFSGIMIGTYGIWYICVTKNVRKLPFVFLACVPTIVYGISYVLVK